jgi:hypothetical protein
MAAIGSDLIHSLARISAALEQSVTNCLPRIESMMEEMREAVNRFTSRLPLYDAPQPIKEYSPIYRDGREPEPLLARRFCSRLRIARLYRPRGPPEMTPCNAGYWF